MSDDNRIILDFKDYPDIDIYEFSNWFHKRFFMIPQNPETNMLFLDNYEPMFTFEIKEKERQIIIRYDGLADYSKNKCDDPAFIEALEHAKQFNERVYINDYKK